jgi:hypothetical protein
VSRKASCLIAWIACAACGGAKQTPSRPPPPAPAPVEKASAEETCQQGVEVLFAITAANEPAELRTRASKVFVHRCEADHWSAEIRRCMAGVKAPADGDRCEALLTPEQNHELRDELARELDTAGVHPQTESGKPRDAGPKPDAAKKQDARQKDAKKKSKSKSSDPCQGGE